MRYLIIIAVSIVMLGCATTPTPISSAIPVPKERLLALQEKSSVNSGTIVVVRDEGFINGGCYLSFAINGALVGRFDVAEIAQFYVQPGEHMLRVSSDPQGKALCSYGYDTIWTQRETMLKPNDKKVFRLSIDANGKYDVQRVE